MPGRRFLTIPGYLLAWLLCVAAAPFYMPLLVLVDLLRGRRAVAVRSAAFLIAFFSCEMLGLAACAGLSIWKLTVRPDEERWQRAHYRLQAWWGSAIFGAVVHIFGVRIEVEGEAGLDRGPYLLLVRHASSADTLLASALVSRRFGIRLRYVIKRELLWDPCLDVVGHRLPNVFIDRFSDDSDREIERLRDLARDLGPRDGILTYPEGTRFTPARRERILERLRAKGDAEALADAEALESVLPPRPRGTLALLAAAPEADVVICMHAGFEGTASLAQIWRGALVGRNVRVKFRRICRSEIPDGDAEALAWLLGEWRRVDAWGTGEGA
jgi:1-acyl-sn-glycerol-3-phosphate acyltransferase